MTVLVCVVSMTDGRVCLCALLYNNRSLENVLSNERADHPVAAFPYVFHGALYDALRIPLVDGKEQASQHKCFSPSLLSTSQALGSEPPDELKPAKGQQIGPHTHQETGSIFFGGNCYTTGAINRTEASRSVKFNHFFQAVDKAVPHADIDRRFQRQTGQVQSKVWNSPAVQECREGLVVTVRDRIEPGKGLRMVFDSGGKQGPDSEQREGERNC
mmetsp:Transcript_29479/g.63201  ORF Transcript_29479/g.63201 Transcript_29479/m.63201 type:complete len:215 (-) Transcript_29479:492-1136(-)